MRASAPAIGILVWTCMSVGGCAWGPMAAPRTHLAMRPDYRALWIVGSWQVDSPARAAGNVRRVSVAAAPDGTCLWDEGHQKWRLRAVPCPGDGQRALVEMQIAEIEGEAVANGWSMLAVITAQGEGFTLAMVRGDRLAERMRQDGHSGHFVQGWLSTEVDVDTAELLETLALHETELLGPAAVFRAVPCRQ